MIIHLVTVGAGAGSRRRTDILNSYKKLDDLHVTLWKEGYVLSIQDLYFRLIPRRADNQEGKRHARTVLVNLLKARNTLRNRDFDVDFILAIKDKCVMLCLYLELLALLLLQSMLHL